MAVQTVKITISIEMTKDDNKERKVVIESEAVEVCDDGPITVREGGDYLNLVLDHLKLCDI